MTRLGDATILPGFIDLHVHQSPAVLLREGVTTTRNLGEQLSTLRPPYAVAASSFGTSSQSSSRR